MNIYLDDDVAQPLLAKLLRDAGHDVQLPSDAGLSGQHDGVHLLYAVKQRRAFLTGNHDDFLILHNLVTAAQGHHPGVFAVRRDNDPTKDLSPKGVVRSLRRYIDSGSEPNDQFVVLNHWR